jgi:predicted nucleic acid-binding protein
MIFVDTAAFLAIENRRDTHHERALAFREASLGDGRTFVTSDYVLDESYTLIRLRAGHAVAVQFGEDVRASRVLRIEHVTPEVVEAAWRIFKAFADKEFSFTDCTSFALMEHLGISTAFTFDEHFRQYGQFVVQP